MKIELTKSEINVLLAAIAHRAYTNANSENKCDVLIGVTQTEVFNRIVEQLNYPCDIVIPE